MKALSLTLTGANQGPLSLAFEHLTYPNALNLIIGSPPGEDGLLPSAVITNAYPPLRGTQGFWKCAKISDGNCHFHLMSYFVYESANA